MNPFIQLKTIVVVFVLLAWAGIGWRTVLPQAESSPAEKGRNCP